MSKFNIPLYKLLLIGDSGVGKTSLLCAFSKDGFKEDSLSTIGIDFKVRIIELDGKKIKLQIWDTAGQERFRTITTSYYRRAQGVMLVYDVTNEKSFENLNDWIRNIQDHASEDVEKILLGTKCDLTKERKVTTERGEKLAAKYGIKFLETSAKLNKNVEEAFYILSQEIYATMEEKEVSQSPPKSELNNILTISTPAKKLQNWFTSSGCSIL